jgi:hypothetical protein
VFGKADKDKITRYANSNDVVDSNIRRVGVSVHSKQGAYTLRASRYSKANGGLTPPARLEDYQSDGIGMPSLGISARP